MRSVKFLSLLGLFLLFSQGVLCQESGGGFGPIDSSGIPEGGMATAIQASPELQFLADSSCQTQLFDPSVIFHFDTIYNWACGGNWNGAPVDSTNGPTDHQRQLALDLSFYDTSDSGSVYVELHNLTTGNGINVWGSCYDGFALTGVMVEAPGVLSVDLDQARPGQEVCYGDCSNPEPLCQLEGWDATVDDNGFSMFTSGCPSFGLVSFGNIWGSTRIRNGFLVELKVDDSFTMDSLTVEIQFGCGQQTIVPMNYSSWGCTDDSACNFDAGATIEDDSCLFPTCDDASACNFDPLAVCGGGECIPSGCREPDACNFDPEAQCDGEECDYSCCPGPGCCDLGMHWDWELGMCQITNVADTNLDGCVQLNDLLDVLSAYGGCGAEELPWQCGDPLEYQGYDYATVLIGNQCWFAENARYLPEVSPAAIGSVSEAHAYVYDYEGTSVTEAMATNSFQEYGAVYNFTAIQVWAICPVGWSVPTDSQWQELEGLLGMDAEELDETNWRGTEEGWTLMSEDWPMPAEPNNAFGFSAKPSGGRAVEGFFGGQGELEHWWTSTEDAEDASWYRYIDKNHGGITRFPYLHSVGLSVRCIKDAE